MSGQDILSEVEKAVCEINKNEVNMYGPVYIKPENLENPISLMISRFGDDLDLVIGVSGSKNTIRPDPYEGDIENHPYSKTKIIQQGVTELPDLEVYSYYNNVLLQIIADAMNKSKSSLISSRYEPGKCKWVNKNTNKSEPNYTGKFKVTFEDVFDEKCDSNKIKNYC